MTTTPKTAGPLSAAVDQLLRSIRALECSAGSAHASMDLDAAWDQVGKLDAELTAARDARGRIRDAYEEARGEGIGSVGSLPAGERKRLLYGMRYVMSLLGMPEGQSLGGDEGGDLDARLSDARRAKEAALDAGDMATYDEQRDREKALLAAIAERTRAGA